MSLSALAIVGRHRTPFYMRDFTIDADNLSSFGIYGQGGLSEAEFFGDHFGIADDEAIEKTSSAWPCNLHHQFLLQAACDQLEEALREGRWRPNGSGADACWVGSVMTSDNYKAFAYVTTNVRYISLIEDEIASDNPQVLKSHDNDLKNLFANIHRLYTDHLLNPFASPNSKITSKRFDLGVIHLADKFNGR
mmetsp:Transcript_7790/g.16584  ORF Transcript_7790/g.16584 Transcript_7790/m.16584 type:complete len:192 (-) Transcript_7790:194-769(-)